MSVQTSSLRMTVCGIQHFSLFNGPGLRTTVFFKGCPLRCAWCCNPESQESALRVVFDTASCMGTAQCGRCIPQCPHGALYAVDAQRIGFARDLCQNCGICTTVCPSKALFSDGEQLDTEEVMRRILLDSAYIRDGGGVTLSGGEPFMRPQAAAWLLRRCHEEQLHTAVETCGFFDLDDSAVRTALADTDILYYDIKHMDSAKHTQGTELDNARILHNLERIGQEFPQLSVVTRTAIISGFNDSVQEFLAIARFVKNIPNVLHHELLPSNSLCGEKYVQAGLPIPCPLTCKADVALLRECADAGHSLGLHVTILS